jgi:hypothetical protein
MSEFTLNLVTKNLADSVILKYKRNRPNLTGYHEHQELKAFVFGAVHLHLLIRGTQNSKIQWKLFYRLFLIEGIFLGLYTLYTHYSFVIEGIN